MDIYSAFTLFNSIGENEKIEITKKGEVRKIHFDSHNKKHSTFMGIIDNIDISHQPIKVKPWASTHNPGLISFNKFGNHLPKREKKDSESDILVGIYLTFLDENQKPDSYTDSNGFTYRVLKSGDIKGYYSKSGIFTDSKSEWILRYIEYNGKKHYISQKLPENISTPPIKKNKEEIE